MLKNLIAEMARADISQKDLAKLVGKDERSISNKIDCSEFVYPTCFADKTLKPPNRFARGRPRSFACTLITNDGTSCRPNVYGEEVE